MSARGVVIGAGPAGLMAAERLAEAGFQVDVYEQKPSVGRKLLIAGIGGLNITHSEPFPAFVQRYAEDAEWLQPWLQSWGPQEVCEWLRGLGVETFVGSSGRIFPVCMKASPVLRAWLKRLHGLGVCLHVRHAWRGWDAQGQLCFDSPGGQKCVTAAVTVLALGGASWPRLGSDGHWQHILDGKDIERCPFVPSNCGYEVAWSTRLRDEFDGHPLKNVALGLLGQSPVVGECLVTRYGLEGSLIYKLSRILRAAHQAGGPIRLVLDLFPNSTHEELLLRLSRPKGSRSMSRHLRACLGLEGVRLALVYECLGILLPQADALAFALKALPLCLKGPRPLPEAISSAGGVKPDMLDEHLMLKRLPGVFCAGEMLDWDAPTGGYLLTACLSSGVWAAQGALSWLRQTQ